MAASERSVRRSLARSIGRSRKKAAATAAAAAAAKLGTDGTGAAGVAHGQAEPSEARQGQAVVNKRSLARAGSFPAPSACVG